MYIDTSIPSPAALAYLLRHPELDPPGFKFQYSSWECCGWGRAKREWNSNSLTGDNIQNAASLLRITESDAKRIFASRSMDSVGIGREDIARDLEELCV